MNEDSSTADGDTESTGTSNLWYRWHGEQDVPFHRYCDFWPYPGGAKSMRMSDDVEIRYIYGIPRTLLQYTPVVVLASLLLFIVGAEYQKNWIGVSEYVPELSLIATVPLIVAGLGWLVILLFLLRTADVLPDSNSAKALIVYGLISILIVTATYTIFTVNFSGAGEKMVSEFPSGEGDAGNVIFFSDFWLTFLVGGCLVYDMTLRTENMFSKLPEKHPHIIEPLDDFEIEISEEKSEKKTKRLRAKKAYETEFLKDLSDSLESDINIKIPWRTEPYTLRTPTIFATLFILPFFFTNPVVFDGSVQDSIVRLSTDPSTFILAVVPTVLVFVNVVAFFQFLVLVQYFRRLLVVHSADNKEGCGFTLRYRPHHPDGHAGFRDFGRFAIRINTLLILGGFYLMSRFYVGSLTLMPDAPLGSPEMLSWIVNAVGPFVPYLLGVIVWLYFSFWQLHKTMRRGRERCIKAAIEENDGVLPDEKQDFKSAPLWPLNINVLFSIIIGDLFPLVSLIPLLPTF